MTGTDLRNNCRDAVIVELYNSQTFVVGVARDEPGAWQPFVVSLYGGGGPPLGIMEVRAGVPHADRGRALLDGIGLALRLSMDAERAEMEADSYVD